MTDDHVLDRIGEVIGGRYHVDRVLGHGGMGTVFRAVQQPIGRQVAVKILHPELAQDETFVTRFHTEAKAASVLVNPNTVTIYDFGQTEDGSLFIGMEYLDGISLAERLGRGALPWHHTVVIGVQVCRALAEAHRKGIVHRDLKPENIMLCTSDDGSLLVKVLDFGIAKMLEIPGRTLKGVPVTQVGVIVGTPQYMSPEQARGGEPSPAADLYALGVILHEAISGAVPFDDDEPILLLGKHMKAPPPPLTSPFGDISPTLNALIKQLLAKEPGDRPDSASDVGAALRPFVNNLTLPALEVIGPKRPSTPVSGQGLAVVSSSPSASLDDDEGVNDDTDKTDLRDTFERPVDGSLDDAATAITALPSSPGYSSDAYDADALAALPDADDDQYDDENLPSDATRRIHYPSEDVSSPPPALPEEDRTSLRSVVVEPAPPGVLGLRPDQVMPAEPSSYDRGDEADDELSDEFELHPHRGTLLVVIMVVIVAVAGAATGVYLMKDTPADPGIDASSLVAASGGISADNAALVGAGSIAEGDAAVVDGGVERRADGSFLPALEASRVRNLPGAVSATQEETQQETTSEVRLRTAPPGATVYHDDERLCVTPCEALLPTEERITLRFEKRGLPDRTRVLVPGRSEEVRVTLWRPRSTTRPRTKRPRLTPWLD